MRFKDYLVSAAAPFVCRCIGAASPCQTAGRRRAEFVYRERHTVEQTARIVFVHFLTYLFWDTVFYCIYQILCRTFDADYREESQGDNQFVSFGVADVAAGNGAANSLGNFITATAATAAFVIRFYNFTGQNDRIHCFDYSDGKIGCHGAAAAVLGRAETGAVAVALEYAYISFASKQDYLFFNDGNSFNFLYIPGRNTCLAGNTDIDLNRQLIESSVKRNTINIDIRPNNSGAFAAYCNTSINKLLAVSGQEYTYILETVLVTAGIKNPVCIDTYHFPRRGLALSVIRHIYY